MGDDLALLGEDFVEAVGVFDLLLEGVVERGGWLRVGDEIG
jgi:ABC-type uncharacterized transport system permease subunit